MLMLPSEVDGAFMQGTMKESAGELGLLKYWAFPYEPIIDFRNS
jgi:hypothetical protein